MWLKTASKAGVSYSHRHGSITWCIRTSPPSLNWAWMWPAGDVPEFDSPDLKYYGWWGEKLKYWKNSICSTTRINVSILLLSFSCFWLSDIISPVLALSNCFVIWKITICKLNCVPSVIECSQLMSFWPLFWSPLNFQSIFSNVSLFVQKYQSFSFIVNASSVQPSFTSPGTEWSVLTADQDIGNNFVYHHNSKAYIFLCSVFLMIQLSQPYVTTRKATALTMHYPYCHNTFPHFNVLAVTKTAK